MSERERVERFEAAYNRIDKQLGELIERRATDHRDPFAKKVRIAANRFRRLARHADFLLEIGDLRNALVHNRVDTESYLAVPSQRTVEQLERIETLLFSPEQVLPRFERDVQTLEADQSLAEAWQLVRDDGYSRYPVYDHREFVGLLTSNGFARYAASQLDASGTLHLDASAIPVRDVLGADHRRDHVEFVRPQTLIEDVAQSFVRNPRLEAVFITRNGKSHEKPMGIICAPDIAGLDV